MRSSTQSSNDIPLTLGVSRSGQAYASIGELHLNSPYDPVREATRFAARETDGREATTCLILGDTLPYLRNALRERYPSARIISLYYHDAFLEVVRREFPSLAASRHYWSPGQRGDLHGYLRSELSQLDVAGLLVLEWPPSSSAFPRLAARARAAVSQLVTEAAAEWRTEAAFSRVWLHNLLANFLSLESWFALEHHHRPVAIAASGPSLKRAIPLLSEHRAALYLVALPSSLAALEEAGIEPDLVVAVDGGYWAQTHLHPTKSDRALAVAMPLIAARGAWRSGSRPVLLSAGSFIERELLARAGLRPPEILATGTVAASAYELSLLASDGPLIFAGLDLCHDGLADHVRPHTFDVYLELVSRRTAPLLTVVCDRLFRSGTRGWTSGSSSSLALKTYAGWFGAAGSDREIYRLFPSSVELARFRNLDAGGFRSLLADFPPRPRDVRSSVLRYPSLAVRRRIVAALFSAWEGELHLHRPGELAPIFGPHAEPGESRVARLARSLDPAGYLRYLGALRGEVATSATMLEEELLATALEQIGELRGRFLT